MANDKEVMNATLIEAVSMVKANHRGNQHDWGKQTTDREEARPFTRRKHQNPQIPISHKPQALKGSVFA